MELLICELKFVFIKLNVYIHVIVSERTELERGGLSCVIILKWEMRKIV